MSGRFPRRFPPFALIVMTVMSVVWRGVETPARSHSSAVGCQTGGVGYRDGGQGGRRPTWRPKPLTARSGSVPDAGAIPGDATAAPARRDRGHQQSWDAPLTEELPCALPSIRFSGWLSSHGTEHAHLLIINFC